MSTNSTSALVDVPLGMIPGAPHEERIADRLLVAAVLFKPAVLSQQIAVIGRVEDDACSAACPDFSSASSTWPTLRSRNSTDV